MGQKPTQESPVSEDDHDRGEWLTEARRASFRFCPQRHAYEYVSQRRPRVQKDAFRPTSLWRDVVVEGLRAVKLLPANDARCAGVFRLAAVSALPTSLNKFARARMLEYLRGVERVLLDTEFFRHYEVVAADLPYLHSHLNPDTGRTSPLWSCAGQVDAVFRHATGRYFALRVLSTDAPISIGASFWQNLALDTSAYASVLGAEVALGQTMEGTMYWVLHKSSTTPYTATPRARLKFRNRTEAEGHLPEDHFSLLYKGLRLTDETPEEYGSRLAEAIVASPTSTFQTSVQARDEGKLHAYLRDAWVIAQNMREAKNTGWHVKNTENCLARGECPYFIVCTNQVAIDDELRFITPSNPYPELSPVHFPSVVSVPAVTQER